MAHTFTKNHLHVVFSTKLREKLIAENFKPRLWKYVTGICKNIDLIPVAVGGMEDHLHLLFHLPASCRLADAMRDIKTNSSKWMNDHQERFAWQDGYGAFGVSESNLPAVVHYIHSQKEHHRKMAFEDEYLTLLKKHKIDFDARFVFD